MRVNAGQEVERDQVLIDVETNKVILEIVSPSNGIIEDIHVSEGDEVEPGQILMRLRDKQTNEQPAPPKPIPAPPTTDNNEPQRATMGHNGPQRTATGHNTPQRTTMGHNEPQRATP
ncbi:MAG: biotin/lipoyl-containing protein, partial [Alteromonas sp.]